MFEEYSLPEFSERIPLLSRRFIRTGILTTDFTVYDDIKESDKGLLVERWHERSIDVILLGSRYIEQGEWKRGWEVVQTWKAKLSNDIADIFFVYPHFGTIFLELSKVITLISIS